MAKWECMDCGCVWEAEGNREDQICPRCGMWSLMIKEKDKRFYFSDYTEDYAKFMRGIAPEGYEDFAEELIEDFKNAYGRSDK